MSHMESQIIFNMQNQSSGLITQKHSKTTLMSLYGPLKALFSP